MLIYVLLAIIALLFAVDAVCKLSPIVRAVRKINNRKGLPIFGQTLEILVSPVELFTLGRKLAKKYNGIYSWWGLTLASVNINNAEDVEVVCATMKHNEKSFVYKIIKPWLNEGLLLSNGSKWQSRRKILTPAFHFNILRQFWPTLEENGNKLVEILSKNSGEEVNIIPVISEYTLNSICETAMGTKLHEGISKSGRVYKAAIYRLGQLFVNRFSRLYLMSDFIFNLTTLGRETHEELKFVQSFTKDVIKERKDYVDKYGIKVSEDTIKNDDIYVTGKKKRVAMLDLLINAEKDGVIDRSGIQEEVDTFMFEGHDTTASGLTYLLMLIANHKDVQDKIFEELNNIFGESDRQATMEDFTSMKYLEYCIKESLRLYPPVPFISRTLTEDAKLSGYTILKGTPVHIHIYDLHRNEKYFEDPEEFIPERFLPENVAKRHPFAYIPFSAGPRNCIGQRFAMMEIKSCVMTILRKFVLEPVTTPEDVEFQADLVLRNTKPVYVRFIDRKHNKKYCKILS